MSAIDALDRSRRKMLVGMLFGFGIWQALSIADRLLGPTRLPREVRIALVASSLIAWAFWSVQLVRLLRWARRVQRDDAAAAALNDERIQQSRLKAFSLALFAVLIFQVIPILIDLPAAIAAQLTILVGCSVAIGGFLFLERED